MNLVTRPLSQRRAVIGEIKLYGHFTLLGRRAGIEMELASRADQRVLRCLGHVERMDEYRIARRVLMAEVGG